MDQKWKAFKVSVVKSYMEPGKQLLIIAESFSKAEKTAEREFPGEKVISMEIYEMNILIDKELLN